MSHTSKACSVLQILLMTVVISLTFQTGISAGDLSEQDIFISGRGGYHSYRIPAVITTKAGTLLAFCEGRKNSRSDAGNIDLLLRRSLDNGATWQKVQVVWDDGAHTCGNPCPVIDSKTGTIWLLLTWNAGDISESKIQPGFGRDSRRVFVAHSTDDGKTWSTPKEITSKVKKPNWGWYATGPGNGIEIKRGAYKGRLVIPCDHKIVQGTKKHFHSHVIFSDDHGATWKLGGVAPEPTVNESGVVELADGQLLLNMRSYRQGEHSRQIAFSNDGGITWKDQRHDKTLIEPICQASILRYRAPAQSDRGIILFSNPADTKKRQHITVRASFDDAKTWTLNKQLYAGSSAYSSLCKLANDDIGCLYEKNNYKTITFARFSLEWLKAKK